jgi:dihydropteroate synthase-like protein
LVLSVNSTNRERAIDWGAAVVIIPDTPGDWRSLEASVELLSAKSVRFRIDPILEPIGFGLAESLFRYFQARERWPEAEMLMGIGNLTELSDVDSAGVNFLLLAICQELRIGSVLTTEVINWARSSVRECDIARRIVKYAIDERAPPKNLSRDLVALRDHRLVRYGREFFERFAEQVKDRNYRIFAEDGTIHAMAMEDYFSGADPFELFDAMVAAHPRNLDPSHAFYLGYEFCKAELANILGKQYVQDEPLNWGHLTPESLVRHRIKRRRQKGDTSGDEGP